MLMIVIGLSVGVLVLIRVIVAQQVEIQNLKKELLKWAPRPKPETDDEDGDGYW